MLSILQLGNELVILQLLWLGCSGEAQDEMLPHRLDIRGTAKITNQAPKVGSKHTTDPRMVFYGVCKFEIYRYDYWFEIISGLSYLY